MLEPEDDINSISPLYLVVKRLLVRIEKIEGSSDRYLVVDENNKEVINVLINYGNLLNMKLLLVMRIIK